MSRPVRPVRRPRKSVERANAIFHEALRDGNSRNLADLAVIIAELGADVNSFDEQGRTALTKAVFRHNSELVQFLLQPELGVYIDQPEMHRHHQTPLAIAIDIRDRRLENLLLAAGADNSHPTVVQARAPERCARTRDFVQDAPADFEARIQAAILRQRIRGSHPSTRSSSSSSKKSSKSSRRSRSPRRGARSQQRSRSRSRRRSHSRSPFRRRSRSFSR